MGWNSMETLVKIQERKNEKKIVNDGLTSAEKVKAHTEYTEENKRVNRDIGDDKQNYVEDLEATAGESEREEIIRQLSDMTRKLAGKYSKSERLVKNKEGESVTGIQEQRNMWIEHFEELLNRPAPLNPLDTK
ncbi:unnamed protein product [Schistosoma margrebowiei]|uniref:Uncharacterized protein n=1 Tax=Schistosoma margrebowiei TaxID=48269 RepID=A0A183MRY2_9TREM|nr:unnamed protein product [Schistosoma margrebowiei]